MKQLSSEDDIAQAQALARRNGRYAVTNTFLLSSASFLLPVWQLFYTLQLGLSLTHAMVLSASSWVVTAIMNVPTGIWADKFGRLKLFRIGIFLTIITYVPMFFTKNYVILLGVSLVAGFAVSMFDGSLEANAMDSYEKAGLPKKESSRFGSSQMTAAYIGRIGSGILGAWLYGRWPFAPLLLDIIILSIALVQSLSIVEVRSERPSDLQSWKFMKSALTLIRSHRVLMTFMFVTIMVSVGAESFWSAFQQYLILRDVPTGQFGLAFGLIAGASAFAAWGYRKIHERVGWLHMNFITMLFMTIGLVLAQMKVVGVPYVVAILIGLGFGLIYPTAYDVVQHNVRSQYRSTIMSVRQFAYLLGFAFATILVGRYVDVLGRSRMLTIITIQAIVLTGLLLGVSVISRKNNIKIKNIIIQK